MHPSESVPCLACCYLSSRPRSSQRIRSISLIALASVGDVVLLVVAAVHSEELVENVVEPEELVDNVVAVVDLMLAVPSLSLRHTHMPVSSLPACRNGHHRVVEMLLGAGGNKETLSKLSFPPGLREKRVLSQRLTFHYQRVLHRNKWLPPTEQSKICSMTQPIRLSVKSPVVALRTVVDHEQRWKRRGKAEPPRKVQRRSHKAR